MWLRSFGALSAAVLFTNGFAFGQDAGFSPGAGSGSAAYNWLSPAPLAWTPPGFNWSELPFKVYAHEYGGYNSNILNAFPGTKLPPGVIPGDYFIRTDVGLSTKAYVEDQQFFADVDFSTTNYRHDASLDIHNHIFDGGLNWRLSQLCSGTLIGMNSVVEAPQDVLIGPGLDILTSNTLTETGQCHLYQDINVILNSGASTIRHSLPTSQPLNNNSSYVQGGLQYAWNNLDNIELLLKYSNTDYINSVNQSASQQVPEFVKLLYANLIYNYTFSSKLSFSAMAGFAENIGGESSTKPIYSATLNYQPSEKLSFMLASSHLVSPPVSILAATQVTNVQSVSVSYALTPKIRLQAMLSETTTEAGNPTAPTGPAYNYYTYGSNNLIGASFKASYLLTPFTSVVFSLQDTRRSTNSQKLHTDLIMLGLDFRPQ